MKADVIVPDVERVPVYNYVSSCQRPITWDTFRKHVRAHGSKIPGVKDIRLQCMFWNSRPWPHRIFMYLFHLLPAVMVDTTAMLTGRDARSGTLYTYIYILFFFQIYFSHGSRVLSVPERMRALGRKKFGLRLRRARDEYTIEDCTRKNVFDNHFRIIFRVPF